MGSRTSRAARPRAASVRLKERYVRAMKNDQQTHAARSTAVAGDGNESGGNLDKVRDILFGAQLRDSDRRFARLEERIAQETAELKEDVRKRLGVLEQFVKHEVESLADRLKSEHEARSDADKELSRELRDSSKSNEKKLGQVDDHLARVQRELRQQLLDTQQKISDELQRHAQESVVRLAREAADLRAEKLDRTTLAAVLTEMAMRLSSESLPDANGE